MDLVNSVEPNANPTVRVTWIYWVQPKQMSADEKKYKTNNSETQKKE